MPDPLYTDPRSGLRALLERDIEAPAGETLTFGTWPSTDLPEKLVYVAIEQVDGGIEGLDAFYIMSVDVFAETTSTARSVAQAIQSYLLGYPGGIRVAGQGYFHPDRVTCPQTPRDEEWEDENIRRQSAQYGISTRR